MIFSLSALRPAVVSCALQKRQLAQVPVSMQAQSGLATNVGMRTLAVSSSDGNCRA